MARQWTEEDLRAQLFQEQQANRRTADRERMTLLAGSATAQEALLDAWEPVLAPPTASPYWRHPAGHNHLYRYPEHNGPELDCESECF